MKYKKLVRDLIPDIIRENGEVPVTRKLKSTEFKFELKRKLKEEVGEVFEASSKKDLISELADVQEVLNALYLACGITRSDVASIARKKRRQRGAFLKQIYLERVK